MDLSRLTIITRPDFADGMEVVRLGILLREYNLGHLHIRKPRANIDDIGQFIKQLPAEYRKRYTVSEHGSLVHRFGLGGLHLPVASWQKLSHRPADLPPATLVGVSCHSAQELAALPFHPDYAYLGPVSDSLSKKGYKGAFPLDVLQQICEQTPFPLIALGGITPENANTFLRLGFHGLASLGYWSNASIAELVSLVNAFLHPHVLLCGGIDPTAQAGLTADTRYAANQGVSVYTIATAITQQNGQTFGHISPVSTPEVIGQIESLAGQTDPSVAKIGLVTSCEQAIAIVQCIRKQFANCRIVWDPILKSSSGYCFHPQASWSDLAKIASMVDVITPNNLECEQLFGFCSSPELRLKAIELGTDIIQTGARLNSPDRIFDLIYSSQGDMPFELSIPTGGNDIHGTGCLYSTAIAIALAQGRNLIEAAALAQNTVTSLRYRGTTHLPWQTKERKPLGRTIFITHGKSTEEIVLQTHRVLDQRKADIVQLRMKDADRQEVLHTARQLLPICHAYNASLLINDSVDIARLCGADGVHLGKNDMAPKDARRLLGPSAIIGLTCNTEGDLLRAAHMPIDYIGLGPYRFTHTKKLLAPILGVQGYKDLIQSFGDAGHNVPIYAIGGVRPEERPLLLSTGVYGIAMSSALLSSNEQIKL